MTKHTPGPWQAIRKGCGIWKGKRKIAEVNVAYCDESELQANLAVIATAPETAAERDHLKKVNAELLKALKAVRDALNNPEGWRPVTQKRIALGAIATAAIRKAEGAET